LIAAIGQLPLTLCQYDIGAKRKFACRQARIPDGMTDIAGARGIVPDHHRTVQYGADLARQPVHG
jgi:hypothetical protein